MSIFGILLYIFAFVVLSFSSNLIVTTIRRFTQRVRVPPFVFSFFIVGMLTSIGEIAVAINAISLNEPEIFVGSLLGGTLIIYSLILPVAAILSRGLPIHKHLSRGKLLLVLGITAMPALFIIDQTINNVEAIALVALYVALFFIVRAPKGSLKRMEHVFERERRSLRENTFLRLGLGGLLVFLASRDIVTQTVQLSNTYHVSAFLVSLVIIAIGMNLPELTLAFKAGLSKDTKVKDIAVGDLMGSAAANVVIMGVFSLISIHDVTTKQSFLMTFVFIILALGGFFIFTLGRKKLSAKKSAMLVALYVVFVLAQIFIR